MGGVTPAGAPVRTRWPDRPMVGFDTETTGVDVMTDRIVTAALVRRAGAAGPVAVPAGRPPAGSQTVTSWLVDPGVEIPAAAAAIHGVTTEQARAHGRPAAAALDEIADALAETLLRGEPVVAFNASFDLSLLEAELGRHGLPALDDRIGHPVRAVIDPLVLDRHLDRYRRGTRKLGDLCAHYGVATAALHTADVDVVATLDLLRAIVRAFPELAGMSLGELYDLQVGAHRAWADSFNAWRTARGLPGPGAELDWPLRVREPAHEPVPAAGPVPT